MTRAPSVETWRAALGPSSANDVIKKKKKGTGLGMYRIGRGSFLRVPVVFKREKDPRT
jgi:hypothetical protein